VFVARGRADLQKTATGFARRIKWLPGVFDWWRRNRGKAPAPPIPRSDCPKAARIPSVRAALLAVVAKLQPAVVRVYCDRLSRPREWRFPLSPPPTRRHRGLCPSWPPGPHLGALPVSPNESPAACDDGVRFDWLDRALTARGKRLSGYPAEKAAGRLALRYPAKPRPAKPSAIIAHVEASGTVLTLTFVRRLPCWEAGPLSTNDKKPDASVNVWVNGVYGTSDARLKVKL
jgi:hypothetical protein